MQITNAARAVGPVTETAAEKPIRVMIVDDSPVLRGFVARWLEDEPGWEVVARFANGKLAVEDMARSEPDVILLDVDMPVMDGLEALPLLKRARPGVKVLIVSTLTKRNAEISFKAMTLGAVDCVPKPETNSDMLGLPAFRGELIRKIKGLTAVDPLPTVAVATAMGASGYVQRAFSLRPPRVVVIGSSTGGPEALATVLSRLSPALGHVPVLIAQHMPPVFTAALADRLASVTGRDVMEGEDGQLVAGGQIYVAPGGCHMTIRNGSLPRIAIETGPAVNFCRPSVDLLFESAAAAYGRAVLGIVLTGMGRDGAEGATRVANAGGSVIAQDMDTSVIWGMPGAAIEAGACAAVLPLPDIAPVAAGLIGGKQRGNVS